MGHFEGVSTTTNAQICTNATDNNMSDCSYCAEKHIHAPGTAVRWHQGAAVSLHRDCDDLHPDRYLRGTSCLIGQGGGVASRQCRMSPPVSTRWACVAAAVGRCARVGRSAEESEHRRQSRDQWETKTRAQAQKYMTQQRGTFPARRMLICCSTTATSQEHQGRASRLDRASGAAGWAERGFS